MTSFASTLWTLTQSHTITAKTHLVLQALASFQGHRGLFPSHESIAARSGASVRTVIRALETAYQLGIVERTRQRVRRSGRLVNGPNRYRLIVKPLEQAKAAAAHYTQQLRDALARRKQRFFLSDKMAAESHSQSLFSYAKSVSSVEMPHTPDEYRRIATLMLAGLTPEQAGYRGST